MQKPKNNISTKISFLLLSIVSILFLSGIVLNLPLKSTPVIYAQNQHHARIKTSHSYLYKTNENNENTSNKWCLLPQTFFVKIISIYDNIFYKAEFNGIVGFVKRTDVSLVNETPSTPYPTQSTLQIKNNLSCYFRQEPVINSSINNIISIIPSSTSGIEFIGKMIGEEAVDTQGTMWYLVKHNNQLGYIHSYFSKTSVLSQTNTELTTEKLSTTTTALNPLSNMQSLFLIAVIMCPLIVILTLTYKPKKVRQKASRKINHKEEISILDTTKNYHEPEL